VPPTCHTGQASCFHQDLEGQVTSYRVPRGRILAQLVDIIHSRRMEQTQSSYTARLLEGGVDRIGKKVVEEAAEVIIAAKNNSYPELTYEMADLLYHALVLLENQDVSLEAVWEELQRRAATSD
jgi:phosphoribosyl-ATP pyrophosphohydrolase/phosphoribosyl-AMP cyclohydrolase